MDIQRLSMDMAQSSLLEQVGTTMLAKGLQGAERSAVELLDLLDSAAPLSDGVGTKIDLTA